jgi:hypothetical protein
MSSATGRGFTAGLVLAGASLFTVTPSLPLPHLPAGHVDIQLTSGDGSDLSGLANVPVNLFHDLVNIPYDMFEAPYSVNGLIPNFTTDGQHTPDQALWPDYAGPGGDSHDDTFHGAFNFLAGALNYTDSWLVSTPTNVWGWDTANPWNFTALIDDLLPVKALSEPLARNLNMLLEAESPIASADNKFIFHDPLGELEEQGAVPISKLTDGTGYDLGEAVNPVGHGADPLGNGGETYQEIWSNTTAKIDPDFGLGEFAKSLTQDPADNPIQPFDPQDVLPSVVYLLQSINLDFNPLSGGTDSFIFQGAQEVWGMPALFNGLLNGAHGLCPSCDDLIPDSVTTQLGGVLNDVFGPDSGFAQVLVGANTGLEKLLDSVLGSYLPDGVSFAPDATDEPGSAASDLASSIDPV